MINDIDYKTLGFGYHQTPKRYVSIYKDGKWDEGCLSDNPNITINESACVLQYAQTVFEGLKAYRTEDNQIVMFRPELNARRMMDSCKRLAMPIISEEKYLQALAMVVKANQDLVPPYGSNASLYLRPFMFGYSPVLGVKPSLEYEFRIFASPVGSYFNSQKRPLNLLVSDYDRAAPHGTGNVKAGLNYAMSLYPHEIAHEKGYDENLYLDSKTRTTIEETGGANVIFVTKDNKIVTPKSNSILPSITRRSLLEIAKDYLGLEVEEREINIDEIGSFKECGLCGTAAVVSPVKSITYGNTVTTYDYEDGFMGEISKKLYDTLTKIQFDEIEEYKHWLYRVK